MKALIVCTGNTCRSPMLMYMLRRRLAQNGISGIDVDSAGTMDHFKPLSPYTDAVLAAHGIVHGRSFSKFCDRELFEGADVIFTVTEEHAAQLAALYGKSKKIVPLKKIAGQDVADPYGLGQQAYDEVYAQFDGMLDKLTAYLARKQKRMQQKSAADLKKS